MSKKCIKCGEILPDDASFCPHCTTVQTEKKEIKTPRKWRKKAVIGVAVLAALMVTVAFFAVGVFVFWPVLLVAPGLASYCNAFLFNRIFDKYGMTLE